MLFRSYREGWEMVWQGWSSNMDLFSTLKEMALALGPTAHRRVLDRHFLQLRGRLYPVIRAAARLPPVHRCESGSPHVCKGRWGA